MLDDSVEEQVGMLPVGAAFLSNRGDNKAQLYFWGIRIAGHANLSPRKLLWPDFSPNLDRRRSWPRPFGIVACRSDQVFANPVSKPPACYETF
jgi:hypothetical protein